MRRYSLRSIAVRIGKARRYASRRLSRLPLFLHDQRRSSYLSAIPRGELAHGLFDLPNEFPQPHRILELANHFVAHRFDLLGSGWTQVRHGMSCRGLERIVYPPQARRSVDRDGHWLTDYINPPNLAESQRIWQMIDSAYQPIDWQRDFKSGWRWSEQTWHLMIRYAHQPGVDVKVPWELARMQHLPTLAYAYSLTPDKHYSLEFRHQILDFIATNPPRFGVNWYSAMEVGIRAANWLVAYDLFREAGATFDAPFEDVFHRSIYEHGDYLSHDQEWRSDWRGNHYLSAIAGLLFISVYLPADDQIAAWRSFAVRELLHETALQFNPDGSNFEGSTGYHRLSAEIVTYATALIQRFDSSLITADHLERLAKMAAFTQTITKPDGHIPQFGDNDNGRFLKLDVAYQRRTVSEARARYANLESYNELPDEATYWDEDHLDHRHLITLITKVVGIFPKLNYFNEQTLSDDSNLGIARHFNAVTAFQSPNGDLLEGLRHFAFPDFGLYLYRSQRLYLAIRCGAIGQRGNGGHAHNDQLSIELTINGDNLIVDPGTYLYSPLPVRRNDYRSVQVHFTPQIGQREPGRLDLGLFTLGDESRARCLRFAEREFIGVHQGFGAPVYRRIQIDSYRVLIEDSAPAVQRSLPFSPGYGIRFVDQS